MYSDGFYHPDKTKLRMGLSIIYFKESQDSIFLRIGITLINSADPYEMLHFIRFILPGSSMSVKVPVYMVPVYKSLNIKTCNDNVFSYTLV